MMQTMQQKQQELNDSVDNMKTMKEAQGADFVFDPATGVMTNAAGN